MAAMDAAIATAVPLGVALVLGLGVGALGGWFIGRKRLPQAPSDAPEEAAPGTAAPPGPLPIPLPIEIHLVLNVLNRMGMALLRDEHAQDGVAALADYLAELSRLRKPGAAGDLSAVQTVIDRYVRLVEWQRGCETPATITWAVSGATSQAAFAWALLEDLQQTLRGLEGRAVRTLHIEVNLGGQGAPARIVIEAGLDDMAAGRSPNGAAAPSGWQVSGPAGLSTQRTLAC